MEKFEAAEVFSPGEYLKDELEARGWTQHEFAEIIGRSAKLVNEIIAGKSAITPTTANEIGAALGTGAMVWLNLESAYRLANVAPVPGDIERRGKLRKDYPVRELQKRGWIPKVKAIDELEEAVYSFYREDARAAAKRTSYDDDLTRVQQALLIRIRQLAQSVQARPYMESKLRASLDDLRLYMEEPAEIRHVPKFLAECGVRFVICEPLGGSHLDGLCTWLDDASPVIGMTLRFDRIDNFWFVLRHEIEHVLRGDGKSSPVFDENLDLSRDDLPLEEVAANDAAAEFGVPQSAFQDWLNRVGTLYSRERVVGFAAVLRVHPGIVVGQLQHRLRRWDLFRPMLVKIRHLIMPSAVADGYGHVIA